MQTSHNRHSERQIAHYYHRYSPRPSSMAGKPNAVTAMNTKLVRHKLSSLQLTWCSTHRCQTRSLFRIGWIAIAGQSIVHYRRKALALRCASVPKTQAADSQDRLLD